MTLPAQVIAYRIRAITAMEPLANNWHHPTTITPKSIMDRLKDSQLLPVLTIGFWNRFQCFYPLSWLLRVTSGLKGSFTVDGGKNTLKVMMKLQANLWEETRMV
jgi:hypothetical protein